jgi:hypothetical protein
MSDPSCVSVHDVVHDIGCTISNFCVYWSLIGYRKAYYHIVFFFFWFEGFVYLKPVKLTKKSRCIHSCFNCTILFGQHHNLGV